MRLLYSLYCAESWSYRIPMRILGPLFDRLYKWLYFWDPFGYIHKNNPTVEYYIKNIHKSMKIGFYDKNIGMSILRAEGTLAFMFVPYEMLILSVFKKLRILLFRIPISLYFL